MLIYNHKEDKFEEIILPLVPKGYALISVKACGINRADVLQKMGKYSVTPDMPETLGLEISGEVLEINDENIDYKDTQNPFDIKIKDRIMCILIGGGYASHVLVPLNQCIKIPHHLSYIEASALPEAIFTVWHALFSTAGLKNFINNQNSEKTVCINAASSGIGTMAIQMCLAFNFKVIASTSSMQKLDQLKILMDSNNYENLYIFCSKEQSLDEICKKHNLGIDFCLDMLGDIEGLLLNMNKLAKIVCIAFLKGAKSAINIAALMQKQISIQGTMIRLQSNEYKSRISQEINQYILPFIQSKKIKPMIEKVYGKNNINQAHADLMHNQHIGKLVVDMDL